LLTLVKHHVFELKTITRALKTACYNNKEQSVGIIEGYPKIQNCVCIRQSHEETYYNGLFL